MNDLLYIDKSDIIVLGLFFILVVFLYVLAVVINLFKGEK